MSSWKDDIDALMVECEVEDHAIGFLWDSPSEHRGVACRDGGKAGDPEVGNRKIRNVEAG